MTIPQYPHFETIKFLAEQLETSKEGLTSAAVEKKCSLYGFNEIKEKKHNLFTLFLTQFKSPLVYVLIYSQMSFTLFP